MSAESLRGIRIGIVGTGVMAEAMLAGLLEHDLVPARNVVCTHPRAVRREALAASYHVNVAALNLEATVDADVVLLGVKPQMLAGVMAELRGALHPEQLVISIIAGATTTALGDGLEHPAVVRCMPNTPAQIGRGVTVWYATESVDEVGKARTRAMLAALGREFEVHDERQVAMATAVSGTGPTYIFLFIEALTDAAVHLGFPGHLAGRYVGRGPVPARAWWSADGGQRCRVGGVRANAADRGNPGAAPSRLRNRNPAAHEPSSEGLTERRRACNTPIHDAQNPSHRHVARGRGGLAGGVRSVAGASGSRCARPRRDAPFHHRAGGHRALRPAHEASPFFGHRPPGLVVSDAPRVVEEGRAHGSRPSAQQPVHVPGHGEARRVLRHDPPRTQGAGDVDAAQQDAAGQPALRRHGTALSALLRPRGGGSRRGDAPVHEAVRRRRMGRREPDRERRNAISSL